MRESFLYSVMGIAAAWKLPRPVSMAAGCKCDGKRIVRLLGVFTYSEWIGHLNRQSPLILSASSSFVPMNHPRGMWKAPRWSSVTCSRKVEANILFEDDFAGINCGVKHRSKSFSLSQTQICNLHHKFNDIQTYVVAKRPPARPPVNSPTRAFFEL